MEALVLERPGASSQEFFQGSLSIHPIKKYFTYYESGIEDITVKETCRRLR